MIAVQAQFDQWSVAAGAGAGAAAGGEPSTPHGVAPSSSQPLTLVHGAHEAFAVDGTVAGEYTVVVDGHRYQVTLQPTNMLTLELGRRDAAEVHLCLLIYASIRTGVRILLS